jgi:uncharacterized protein YjdB
MIHIKSIYVLSLISLLLLIFCQNPAGPASPISITKISLNKEVTAITVGKNEQLLETIEPASATNKNVVWSSSDTSKASVSSSGLVTALSTGSAAIRVTSQENGIFAVCTVKVIPAVISVNGIAVNKSSVSIVAGGKEILTFAITPLNATNQQVMWESSDTTKVSVSDSGLISAKNIGKIFITVKTVDGSKTAVCSVSVVASGIPITKIALDKPTLTIAVGAYAKLSDTLFPSNTTEKRTIWSSSDTSKITVSDSGLVHGITKGNAVVTIASIDGAVSACCSVTVIAPVAVTGITLNKSTAILSVNDTQQLMAAILPSNATNQKIVWSVSDSSKASVSTTGMVTAKAEGKTAITVESMDGAKAAVCSVSVLAAVAAGEIQSTGVGVGLWFTPETWVGGVVPGAANDVRINGEVQVDAGKTGDTATCRNCIVTANGVLRSEAYKNQTILIKGNLVNYGSVRNGPNYASYDNATFNVRIGGNFTQDSLYGPQSTYFTGASVQTISTGTGNSLSGLFYDQNSISAVQAGSDLELNSFSLDLGSSATGILDMGSKILTIKTGGVTVKNGSLKTTNISAATGTTISCPTISSPTGQLHLGGEIRTANMKIESDLIVDSGAILYNLAYEDDTVLVKGSLINNGIIRRGPGFAAYGEGNLVMILEKDFRQNGIYTVLHTRLIGTTSQTVSAGLEKVLTGLYYDDNVSSAIVAGTDLTFNDFTLDFGAETGLFDMNGKKISINTGAFTIKKGRLKTTNIDGASGTTFSCPIIASPTGPVHLTGEIRTANTLVETDLTVDSGAILYNLAYGEDTVTIKGSLVNNGLIRRGPGFAAYGEGNLAIYLEKDFQQNGTYTVQVTHFSGTTVQTISNGAGKILTGLYFDDSPATKLNAGSDLSIDDARFIIGSVAQGEGSLSMDGFNLYHNSGNLQIDSGLILADTIIGGTNDSYVYTIAKMTALNGTVSIYGRYQTSTLAITGNLILETAGVIYNQYNVVAAVTTSGTCVNHGIVRCGPGYASYDSGHLVLNGVDASHTPSP